MFDISLNMYLMHLRFERDVTPAMLARRDEGSTLHNIT